MIVLVAGMPRAGSMWTYNVIRAIFEARGWSVLPKEVPVDEGSMIRNAFFSHEKYKEVYCIKTHLLLKKPLPPNHKLKIICNIRDVRDACLSYIRFTHANFDAGLVAMTEMMNSTDYYLSAFSNQLLSVRFEDVLNDPGNVLRNVSTFLKIKLSDRDRLQILERFDKSNIKNKLRDLPKVMLDSNSQITDEDQRALFQAVKNNDGTFRTLDKATGFQSNHITSTTDGEWRTSFSSEQNEKLLGLSREWLLKYGYEI